MESRNSKAYEFGGDWTIKKHEVLRRYLDAYTTALKNQPFEKVYIDSHAGDGEWVSDDGTRLEGSPMIALNTQDDEFDELYFNDLDAGKMQRLENLVKTRFAGRQVQCSLSDADLFLAGVCERLKHPKRGVTFFDPCNSRSSWSSMAAIAATEVLDALILFPSGAVWRQLPTLRDANATHQFAHNLTRFFGDDSWKRAYDPKTVAELQKKYSLDSGSQSRLGEMGVESRGDHRAIPLIYKEKLETVFGWVRSERFPLEVNGSPYFELMFAVSNPNPNAHRLAERLFNGVVRSIQ